MAAASRRPARLLHELLDHAVATWPHAVALEIPPGEGRPHRVRWTFAELDRRADALAARLRPRVTGEGVVALLLPRTSPWLFAAEVAVLRVGAAWTAIDPSAPRAHAAHVLADASPVAIVRDGGDVEEGAARVPTPPWLAPRSLAYLIYTSGTTGRPKGVLVEHAGIANLIVSDLEYFDLGPGDRVAQGSSHAYDSSVEETWMAWSAGAAVVVVDDEVLRRGPDLVPWLQGERITVLCPPPTLLRTTGLERAREALPDLRLVYVGGEALERDVVEAWAPGLRLENGYGPTECSVTVLRARVRPGEDIPIGTPVPGNRAWVVDDHLQDVPIGEAGELLVGGVGLARGYLHDEERTATRFPVHPRFGRAYRTGDLVRRDAEGRFHYLGRLDDQVQLHGHRVELEGIDATLAACPGVREAACSLQGSALVGFVVPTDPAAPPRPEDLEARLRSALPGHMVPTRYAVLDRLPRLTSGKLDRRALPAIDPSPGACEAAPRDALEWEIADAVAGVLDRTRVSVEADFFLSLGGDSVSAARVVSALRRTPETASLTVRDVYEARTVAALADRARGRAAEEPDREAARTRPAGRPCLFTVLQAAWLLLGVATAAPVAYAVWFLLVPWWFRTLGLVPGLLALPLAGFAVAVLYTPLAVGVLALVKRVLVGRYRPGRVPAWTGLHLRHWLVSSLAGLVPWGLLRETVFLSGALRVLGARVGRRVHVHAGVDVAGGGWDLLEIGDDATIGQDAAPRTVMLEDGHLVFGRVEVGPGAVLETRAGMDPGTALGADAVLDALSWLPAGARVPDGERWSGVPATPAGPSGDAPEAPAGFSPPVHGALVLLSRFALGTSLYLLAVVLPAAIAIPAADLDVDRLLAWLYAPANAPGGVLALLGFAVASLVLGTLASALLLRTLGRTRPGLWSRWGAEYLRLLAKRETVAAAGRLLSGTLLWPRWLRLAGMRIGRGCEVSTILDVVPETVELGDTCFLADGVYLGGASMRRGAVRLDATRLGAETFLGNHVVVPSGTTIPGDVLVGSATVAGGGGLRRGAGYFGHPRFELPRREVAEMDRRLTHEPGPLRRLTRWSFELLRFLLPLPPAAVLLAWLGVLALAPRAWATATVLAALAGVAAAASLVALVVALKWALLGRVRPGRHALWSCWCSRWDFLYVAWGAWCRPILSALEGTLLLAPVLRLFGVEIGRRVLLGRGFAQVVDPDMLHVGDEATVSPLYQAHSFEDRVLKIDHVRVEAGASVGPGAILFYGARVGRDTSVAPQAVVMKHEDLKAGASYEGAPAGPRRGRP